MALLKSDMDNYTLILKEELIPAMGCTEPIAVAYAASKAAQVLGAKPVHINVRCSGNIIKNVKGVTVPNSGNQKGIEVAATLGVTGGDPDKELEVIAGANDEDRREAGRLVSEGFCEVELEEGVPNLWIKATADGEDGHRAVVLIENTHTNITFIEKDGVVVYEKGAAGTDDGVVYGDRSKMSLKGLLEYADTVDIADVKEVLDMQIKCNTAISNEGLTNDWGASVGKTLIETWGNDVKIRACARAAAGSDARMSGCPLPVVINSGSGNQGITVTMPVVTYAEEWGVSQEKLYRALLVSNLVSVYIKHYIGALSAFCGAVSAGCSAATAIAYMDGADYDIISKTITNSLGNVCGIICDGAKSSCAAKIASSVNAGLMAYYMAKKERAFKAGEGVVEDDVEKTIKNVGYIGKVGLANTDIEILNVMIGKVDVDKAL